MSWSWLAPSSHSLRKSSITKYHYYSCMWHKKIVNWRNIGKNSLVFIKLSFPSSHRFPKLLNDYSPRTVQHLIISVSLSGRAWQYFDPCKITLWGLVKLVFTRKVEIKIDSNKMTITLTLVSLVGYTLFDRQLGLRVLLTVCRPMFNNRNMEHSGTSRNIE